jgi:hypothetical protein
VKSHKLARFVAPPPPPKPVCAACKSWTPEVTVPVGDGAIDLCWLCAHHHVDHGASLRQAPEARCECTAAEIYPAEYRPRKVARVVTKVANRGEAIAHLVANGMSRQQAKAQTFAMDAIKGDVPRWRSRGK